MVGEKNEISQSKMDDLSIYIYMCSDVCQPVMTLEGIPWYTP